ncbi:glycosyl hydrolase family 43 [Streptohalobacillus salinus]|uniref:Glycosyl hydrolase family 43 n=1 Tax=Streptohalobacillus salinus TaxID=621096 RepID=A0A2V3WI28_9BACI|nr:family 43 glycosylhydrolase [Streptohalobacillus salinus]PXW88459.1 glycosyl hydrolase family 43 [Streptohalobacillus salinus]
MKRQAKNPYLPSYEYVPDGEPYVFGDRLYVYGSHDKFNGKLFCLNDYVCWSAPVDDLSNWRCEGVIYKKNQDPMNRLGFYQMYAPDMVEGSDGRYYLYYTLAFQSVIAIAVSDTPAGHYQFYGYLSDASGKLFWNNHKDPLLFDPGVLVDDDGRVYLYSGFAPKNDVPFFLTGWKKRSTKGGYVIELESDMKTVKTEPVCIFPKVGEAEGTGFEGHEFFEASSIRKIADTYYFIYSSINGHELCYATSQRPTGGFTYRGTIISNGDLFINGCSKDRQAYNYIGNNHGSIVCVKNQWYVFYHRQTNRHHYSRQGLAEPIDIQADGTIPQVGMSSSGLTNGPLVGKGEYQAAIACHLMAKHGAGRYGTYFGALTFRTHPYFTQTGKDRENHPTQYIANMRDGAVAGFKSFLIEDLQEIAVQVQSTGVGVMYVSTALSSEPIAEISVNKSNRYSYFRSSVDLKNKEVALYFCYKGSGKVNFKSFVLNEHAHEVQ